MISEKLQKAIDRELVQTVQQSASTYEFEPVSGNVFLL